MNARVKPTPLQEARQAAAQLANGLSTATQQARMFGDRAVAISLEEADSMRETAARICVLLVDLDNGTGQA